MKKRARKSKKREDESDENDSFSNIPHELKVDILMRLNAESIARLGFVSKHWSSIINGKDFTDLYLNRSLTEPRFLFSVYNKDTDGNMQMNFFHSCSQEDPSCDHRRISFTLKNSNIWYSFTQPIGGLIFGRKGNKAIFGNPSTGQFVSLPNIKTRRKEILSVFGYDPVNDVYKVLSMTAITKRGSLEHMSEEHQVITLGHKQKWRSIRCKYPHRHYSDSQGICRNGVVYYLASVNNEQSLISFDLRSEEFHVINLPEECKLQEFGISVNHYSGKITIVIHGNNNGQVDLWVLEDASKEEWLKVSAAVPCLEDLVGDDYETLVFWGILRTGEIMLSPFPATKPFSFLCYDVKKKNTRQIVIDGIGDDSAYIGVFFDHAESHMLVSRIR